MQNTINYMQSFTNSALSYVPTSLQQMSQTAYKTLSSTKMAKAFGKYAFQGAVIGSSTLLPYVFNTLNNHGKQGSLIRGFVIPVFSDLHTAIAGVAFATIAWPTYKILGEPLYTVSHRYLSEVPKVITKTMKTFISKENAPENKEDKKSLYAFLPFQFAMGTFCFASYRIFTPICQAFGIDSPFITIPASIGWTAVWAFVAKNKIEDAAQYLEKQEWFKEACTIAVRSCGLIGRSVQAIIIGAFLGRSYLFQEKTVQAPISKVVNTAEKIGTSLKSHLSSVHNIIKPFTSPVFTMISPALSTTYNYGKETLYTTIDVISEPVVQKAALTIIGTFAGLYGLHYGASKTYQYFFPQNEEPAFEATPQETSVETTQPQETAPKPSKTRVDENTVSTAKEHLRKESLLMEEPSMLQKLFAKEKSQPISSQDTISESNAPEAQNTPLLERVQKQASQGWQKVQSLFANSIDSIKVWARSSAEKAKDLKVKVQKEILQGVDKVQKAFAYCIEAIKLWFLALYNSCMQTYNQHFISAPEKK